jgi:hypothetical protein
VHLAASWRRELTAVRELTAQRYGVQMRNPVCVFIYRDPLANAQSLMENSKKSAQSNATLPMTVDRWLATWEQGAPRHLEEQCSWIVMLS